MSLLIVTGYTTSLKEKLLQEIADSLAVNLILHANGN
jgi:hypothetical protein